MQGAARGLFFRLSEGQAEYPDETITKATMRGGFYHGIHEIEADVTQAYRGHHQYDWVRPRRTWLDAACPVYIDFGDDRLVRLETYDEPGLRCIRFVSKRKFVHDVMVETDSRAIATRFIRSGATDGGLP